MLLICESHPSPPSIQGLQSGGSSSCQSHPLALLPQRTDSCWRLAANNRDTRARRWGFEKGLDTDIFNWKQGIEGVFSVVALWPWCLMRDAEATYKRQGREFFEELHHRLFSKPQNERDTPDMWKAVV
ncbi:hypothetical protein NDU88_008613 [Pleurodeles waltl]|uniref:Uncharacterized protein n=1 Tax=Pleurodeles waltl TaxID=8319 RepID=A0AAV7QSA8_PLEWA|nr:hypothetical protein NDU88_008613 [Pleurodeles waltl]